MYRPWEFQYHPYFGHNFALARKDEVFLEEHRDRTSHQVDRVQIGILLVAYLPMEEPFPHTSLVASPPTLRIAPLCPLLVVLVVIRMERQLQSALEERPIP